MKSPITWLLIGWLAVAVIVSILFRPKEAPQQKLTIKTFEKRQSIDAVSSLKEDLLSLAKLVPAPADQESDPAKKGAIPHETNLTFRNSADLQKFLEVARSKNISILGVIDKLNAVRIKVSNNEELRDLLSQSPQPKEQAQNYLAKAPDIPNSSELSNKSSLASFGDQTLAWLGVPTDHQGWGKGITVAVLDTGITKSEALKGKISSLDLTSSEAGDSSYHGHGTAVASLIAGSSTSVNGIAPSANLLSIRVLGADGIGDTFTVAQGIMEAVDRGARIINMSLGSQGDSSILREAVEYAIQHGVAIVAAAGNESQNELSYPAKYPGVLAVGAIDAQEQHLPFSNTGNQIGVAAPGYGLYASWSNDQMISFTGTSAATPLVSGALAMILSQNPYMSGLDAGSILMRYSDDSGAPGFDNEYGFGILNMQRILSSNQSGINDMAMASHYIQQDSPTHAMLLVNAQNRGTERLASAQLNISIGGGLSQTYYFTDIEVGKTVTQSIPLDMNYIRAMGNLSISSSISIPGYSDIRPTNNQSTSVISPSSP